MVFISDNFKNSSDDEDSSVEETESVSEQQPQFDLGFSKKGLGFILDDKQDLSKNKKMVSIDQEIAHLESLYSHTSK